MGSIRASVVPELTEVKPLLEQSARGIELVGASSEEAATAIKARGASTGLERLQHLFSVLRGPVQCP